MNVKQHVTEVVRTMPDDVTLDEVIYWVGVMDMVGGGVPSQEASYFEMFTDLQQDMAAYFRKKKSERTLRSAVKSKKARSVGAA